MRSKTVIHRLCTLASFLLASCTQTTHPTPASSTITAVRENAKTLLTQVKAALGPATPSPLTLDVLIDASPGSPGADKALVRPTMTTIASVIAGIPDSIVREWTLGDDASRTTINVTITITAPKAPGRAATQNHQASEQRRILAAYDKLTLITPKRSPLLSSVVRVTQETRPAGTRHVLIIDSDLLEHSDLGDLECDDPLPSVWQARLRQARLFQPGTMTGTNIIAVNTGLRPVANQRCTASVAHHQQVIDLWTTTARTAGATFTAITGNLTSDDLAAMLNPKEKK